MSYILDALRKAESERERDAGAGLPPPVPGGAAFDAPPPSLILRVLPGLAVGLGLGLAGLLAWSWLGRDHSTAPGDGVRTPSSPQASVAPAEPTPPPQPSTLPTISATPPAPSVAQVPPPAPTAAPVLTPRQITPAPRLDEAGPAELPPDIRASLPPLVIGGAMHSDTPASRMIVINGRLFHEGDTLAPDLVLDKIQLKSAVLRYRGQRYTLTY
jgi:general secretion pathway protein B